MRKIVLGLSDGVDSAVAAKLLIEDGFDVIGLYLDIAGAKARNDAAASAAALGIPLRVLDISAALERHVMAPFAAAYLRGETPSPCIGCNPAVKFAALTDLADALGAAQIATGHYARAIGGRLYRGAASCDQSYMLCRLLTSQLDRLVLPLGALEKTAVRAMAKDFALPAAQKPDSRELCFAGGQHYANWLEARGVVPPQGDFLYGGQVVGRHGGIHRYTVGQRVPPTADGRWLYVAEIRPDTNEIVLARWDALFSTQVAIRDFRWLTPPRNAPFRAAIRVRHTRWETPPCTVVPDGDVLRVTTDTPLRAPAKGQAAALYDGEAVVGGGYLL